MAKIKCKACGERYNYYEHGCCPECGAYNRPPRRDRVDADGTVHHLNDSEFFDDSAARRRQSGKVCFEREECHEEQVRRSASPFDSAPSQKKKKDSSSAGGVKKLVKTVAIAVVLANLLPVLLTMCSFSDVMDSVEDLFTNVDVEPVRPEPLPDGETAYTTYIGNTFIWWDHDAAVVDVTMDQQAGTTFLDMTMWRVEAYDEPVVFYDTVDGWQEKAGCENVTVIDEETFVYSYILDDYQPGGECYAFFDGYNGNVYCEVKVPLENMTLMSPLDDSSSTPATDVTDAVQMGETFLWWDEEATLTKASVHESGAGTDVNLTMQRADSFDDPIIYYITRSGAQMMAFCQSSDSLGKGNYHYFFHMDDRQPGTECWAVFGGFNDGQHCETKILLNGGKGKSEEIADPVTTMPQKVIVNDVVLNTSGKTTIVEAMVQTDPEEFLPMPTLRYTDKDGEQQEAECRNYIRQGSGDVRYTFRVKNMEEGSSIALRFTDPLGMQPTMVVPLN